MFQEFRNPTKPFPAPPGPLIKGSAVNCRNKDLLVRCPYGTSRLVGPLTDRIPDKPGTVTIRTHASRRTFVSSFSDPTTVDSEQKNSASGAYGRTSPTASTGSAETSLLSTYTLITVGNKASIILILAHFSAKTF